MRNGFKISLSKTRAMHYTRLQGLHPTPMIKLYGYDIPYVEQYKFLEIIFHKKLSFKQHVAYLKNEFQKLLSLMRSVTSNEECADQCTLMLIYWSIVFRMHCLRLNCRFNNKIK